MWPASGARLPVMRLNAVVLPAPLPPIRLVIVPAFTANDNSLTARSPPNDFDSASSLSTVPPVIATSSLQHVAIFADQPLTAIPGEDHKQEPIQHLPQLRRDRLGDREELERLRQENEDDGGQHRAVEAAGAADDDQRDDEDRLVQGERDRIDRGQEIDVDRSRRGGENGGEDEDRELDVKDVLAERGHRRLVLAHGAQQPPERRIGDTQRQQIADDGERDRDQEFFEAGTYRVAEQRRVRNAVKARGSSGDVKIHEQAEDDRLKAQRR